MICKFCGNEIDDGSDFCYICGQKVEESVPAFAAAADVYSQPAAAPAQAPAAPAPAPVAASQPVQPAAPAQAPVTPAAYAAAPAAPNAYVDGTAEQGGKKKKAKKPKDPNMASRAQRFFSFILFFIVGPILYNKEKKNGNEAKAISILNATMRGLCVFMAIIVVVMIKKFVM
ncbi:MAG: hypothetical protein ACI4XE_02995 [Acutalibacteraceae bacterium]